MGASTLVIVPTDRFEEMHELVGSPAFDLPLENWRELYDLTLEFRPDLVLELGRGYGNSTTVFTEAAQSIQCRVVSIGFDAEHAWETRTAPRLAQLVDPQWFAPLTVIQQDITTFDFRPLLQGSARTLVYWDAHGADVAAAIFERLIPALPQENVIVVDDVWQRLPAVWAARGIPGWAFMVAFRRDPCALGVPRSA